MCMIHLAFNKDQNLDQLLNVFLKYKIEILDSDQHSDDFQIVSIESDNQIKRCLASFGKFRRIYTEKRDIWLKEELKDMPRVLDDMLENRKRNKGLMLDDANQWIALVKELLSEHDFSRVGLYYTYPETDSPFKIAKEININEFVPDHILRMEANEMLLIDK